jgi:hypothetical protein
MTNLKNLRLFSLIGSTVFLLIAGSMAFGIWLNKLEPKLPQDKELLTLEATIDSVAWVEYKNTAQQLIIKFNDSLNAARLSGYSLEASDQKALNLLKSGDSLKIRYKDYKIRKGSVFQDVYPWWQFKEIWAIEIFHKLPANPTDSSLIQYERKTILKAESARQKIISTNLSQAEIILPIWILMLIGAIASGFFSIYFLNKKDD